MKKFVKHAKLDKHISSVEETLYLLKSPKNAERLKQAISDFEANKNFKITFLQNPNDKNFRN